MVHTLQPCHLAPNGKRRRVFVSNHNTPLLPCCRLVGGRITGTATFRGNLLLFTLEIKRTWVRMTATGGGGEGKQLAKLGGNLVGACGEGDRGEEVGVGERPSDTGWQGRKAYSCNIIFRFALRAGGFDQCLGNLWVTGIDHPCRTLCRCCRRTRLAPI